MLSSMRAKLLLISLIPMLALVVISIYSYIQVSAVSDEVRELAMAEIELINTKTGNLLATANDSHAIDIANILSELKQSIFEAEDLELQTIISVSGFSLAVILIGLFFNFFIFRAIQRPLVQAIDIAKRIGEGERRIDIYDIPNDEMGQLLKVLLQTQRNVRVGEEALLESEHQIRMITDSIPAMVSYLDKDMIFQFCNYEYAKYFNRVKDDIIGQKMENVVGEKIFKVIAPNVTKVLSGKEISFDLQLMDTDNKIKFVVAHYIPDFDKDNVVKGFFSIVQDVTRQELAKQEIENQRQELERLSQTDVLTGVYNRRCLISTIEEQIARFHRYKVPLSIIMLDLDHFKVINDTYGHSSGDDVLRIVSKILKKHVRETDFVCRYGGEEFSVVMPETNLDEADILAERLRLIIEEAHIPISATERIDFTCSIGLSVFDHSIRNADTFIAVADKALYQAKRQGRNQVVIAETLSPAA